MEPTTEPRPREGSGAMFNGIAARYDLLNRVISLGLDQRWRRRAVESVRGPVPLGLILDLATGTGDVAALLANAYPDARVVGLDPADKMLDVGRRKLEEGALTARVSLEVGSAEELPFEEGSVSGITMAFGIRNVVDRPKALREMVRVLAPGSRAAILELSEPDSGVLGAFSRLYIHGVVPLVGSVVAGRGPYAYLAKSIAAFPSGERFATMMKDAGFASVEVIPLTFGVAHLYVGVR